MSSTPQIQNKIPTQIPPIDPPEANPLAIRSEDAPAEASGDVTKPSLRRAAFYLAASAAMLGLPALLEAASAGLPPQIQGATANMTDFISAAGYLLGLGFGMRGALALKEAHAIEGAEPESAAPAPARTAALPEPAKKITKSNYRD